MDVCIYVCASLQPVDDQSMEEIKQVDTTPIELYNCFEFFVKEDQLGEEELW